MASSLRPCALPTCCRRSRDLHGLLRRSILSPSSVPWVLLFHPSSLLPPLTRWLSHFTRSRGFGRRMHLGVEVTESSTNKQHHLSRLCLPSQQQTDHRRPFNSPRLLRRFRFAPPGSCEPSACPSRTQSHAEQTLTRRNHPNALLAHSLSTVITIKS